MPDRKIPITLGYVAGTKFEEEISLLMQSNLEQLGFVVTQQPDPWNRITEIAGKVETTPNVNQIFFGPTYPSPDSMFFTQYHSSAAGTWASMEWMQDPEIDALIDEARATGDVAEAGRALQGPAAQARRHAVRRVPADPDRAARHGQVPAPASTPCRCSRSTTTSPATAGPAS